MATLHPTSSTPIIALHCFVPQDAMHYFVDNMFRNDKAPYCSNCSRDAGCLALLLVRRRV